MKWVLYNLLFAAVYPLLLPGFILRMSRRGGYAARFLDRFALYPPEVAGFFHRDLYDSHSPAARAASPSDPVWIHAVSVGEVQVAGQLMREWRRAEPGVRFCFSTTSSTGWQMAADDLFVIGDDRNDLPAIEAYHGYTVATAPDFMKTAAKKVYESVAQMMLENL